jgi:TMEM175 potassium channel family protein
MSELASPGGDPQAGDAARSAAAARQSLMDSARLEAFSDGVFAVAITLLALNLVVPGPGHGKLSTLLGHAWPSFAGYLVSFLTIGIIWVNHHTLFKNFAGIDRPLLFINLLLLFFVVAIPFATKTFADYLTANGPNASLAAAVFVGVFEGMSIGFVLLFWWAIKHEHLKVKLTPEGARRAAIRFGIGNLGYIAAIGIAFVSPYAALVISLVVALYYVFEQTPARKPAPEIGAGGDSGEA